MRRGTGVALIASGALLVSGCSTMSINGGCSYDPDFEFQRMEQSTRDEVAANVATWLAEHPGSLDMDHPRVRTFCEVFLLDVRGGERDAYGRATCMNFSARSTPDGVMVTPADGAGAAFHATLEDGLEVASVELPRRVTGDGEELLPEDLRDDLCQVGFAKRDISDPVDVRLAREAERYFEAHPDEVRRA